MFFLCYHLMVISYHFTGVPYFCCLVILVILLPYGSFDLSVSWLLLSLLPYNPMVVLIWAFFCCLIILVTLLPYYPMVVLIWAFFCSYCPYYLITLWLCWFERFFAVLSSLLPYSCVGLWLETLSPGLGIFDFVSHHYNCLSCFSCLDNIRKFQNTTSLHFAWFTVFFDGHFCTFKNAFWSA